MKLIVGLGNPGPKYEETRHNVGFAVVRCLAARWQISMAREKFHAFCGEGIVAEESTVLLTPTTYMNRSGQAVQAAGRFYKLNVEDLLVINDDLDLPLGFLRLRARGSSGGHKGLADIEQRIGTPDYARLRVGIGQPAFDATGHVLGRFDALEEALVGKVVQRSADAADGWIRQGSEATMNRFNGWVDEEARRAGTEPPDEA